MGIISVLFFAIGYYFQERKMVILALVLSAVFLFLYLVTGQQNKALIWIQTITGFVSVLELLRQSDEKKNKS